MHSKAVVISALLAYAEARFSREQEAVPFVSALSNFGNPGEAATLAGAVPGVMLAAANPCAKLELADRIVATLGNDPQVIAGAAQVVGAEQNFNPFVVSIPNICGDASLPATPELRGIVPLVDPAVTGSDVENANAAASLTNPFGANGLSVADVMKAQGFSNFTTVGGAGGGGNANAGGNAGNAGNNAGNGNNNNNNNKGNGGAAAKPTIVCGGAAPPAATSAAAGNAGNNAGNNNGNNNGNGAGAGAGAGTGAGAAAGAGAVTNDVTGNFPGFQASSLGLDFGTCTPTVKFEESLNGRKAGEFTFQAQDPVVNKGQQEALNPNIIFNRICDQLTNVCGAAADAKAACKAAQAKLGTGPKDATTANAWNSELGFAGVNINPDNAPKAGLVGHT